MKNSKLNNISKLFILFMIYSFFGYLYEILYETFLEHWTYMPREFFRGPICPIYGIGGIIIFLVFRKLIESKNINLIVKALIIFLGTFFISSIIEYIASYILEMFTCSWPWQSYVDYPLNFGGRVALPTSIKFGVLGVVFVLLLNDLKNKFFDFLESKNLIYKVALVLLVIFVLDFMFAIIIPTGVKLNVERTKW